MADMYHHIRINAPRNRVYEALTQSSGLSSWWTDESSALPQIGSVATFGFGGGKTILRMRIDELEPEEKVVWTCLGDMEEWVGTRLTWEIEQTGEGTDLRLMHAYWRSTSGSFAFCNSTWGALLYHLRDHLQGTNRGPLF